MVSRNAITRAGLALLGLVSVLPGCGEERFSRRPPFFAASTDLIDFGETFVGDDEERTVFIINKGDKEMSLQNPTGDMQSGVFAVIVDTLAVPAGDDVVARVVFSPADVRQYSTSVTFVNDSDNEPKFILRVTGAGVVGDPCRNVSCATPPAPQCLSSTRSRVFSAPGTCEAGACKFQSFDEECASGCDAATGRCKGDPCAGITCQTPPNNCFKAQGQCVRGACQYLPNDGAVCDDGNVCTKNDACSEGSCRGTPLACNAPPPDGCISTAQRRFWDPIGTCNAQGSCQYTSHDVSCDYGCTSAACQGDPCLSLNCNDNNPCTTDSCDPGIGCKHVNLSAGACLTGSGDCPQGTCSNGLCVPKAGVVCQAEIDVDLCNDVEVPGVCTGAGQCVATTIPPEYECDGCNGICIQCYILQLCIPLDGT